MKIAFLYGSFFRHGGIQRVVARVVNELAREHQISLICTDEFDLKNNIYNIDLEKVNVIYMDLFESKNKSIYIIDKLRRIFLKYNLISVKKSEEIYFRKRTREKIIKLITDEKFDIIISCAMFFNLLLGSIHDKVSSKLIGWEHNPYDTHFSGYNNKNKYAELCTKLLCNLDSLVFLTEKDRKNFSLKLGVKGYLIPNPLSFSSEKKTSSKNKNILIVGRLEKVKGTDILIDIIYEFCKINKNWNFKVIGEGDMEKFFIDKIKEKKINDRVFLSKFTDNISKEYVNSDIYICTSRSESFGLTVLEAMQHGLPVVTFNTSGPSEIVENKFTGYVINNYDVNEFVNHLHILCTSDKLRKDMANKAIIRSHDFSIEKIMEKWNVLLNDTTK